MFARFAPARKTGRRLILGLIAGSLLAACVPSTGTGPRVNTRNAVPVALLVPQTGAAAGVGASLTNAARLAVADLSGAEIDLRVYDTGGTAGGAAEAAASAARDGVRIIIGPLFADAAAAAGNAVAGRGLSVLSFSNNAAVAGGNVFVLGTTFQTTANRLLSYAGAQGVRDIAIVHAESDAEILGRDAIASAIGANGLRLSTTASFPLSQNGIVSAAPGIVRQIEGSGTTGVFLTSGNDGALPFVAELLPGAGLDRTTTQVIGLQRLDIPPSAQSLPGLQGAWFALPDPGLAAQFSGRYQGQYGRAPHPLASLAYDGVAAVGALIGTGETSAFSRQALTRPSGFLGVGGVFRLRPNGTADRGLAVAQIQNNGVVILDPAPRSFAGAGL